MPLNLSAPNQDSDLKPSIVVIGIGGAGGNAVNNMINSQLEGVDFIAANTDAQALELSLAPVKIQLGREITKGLGAGAKPEIGRAAAEEAKEEINEHLQGANMVFITSGMGGGTGTGAAPVVAQLAREKGILTVGVVTKPFNFEGSQRMRMAQAGIEELQSHVDTLIVIPNQNLFRVANENTTFTDAFKMADEVLHSGVRGVTDLMVVPGHINLDFADIRTVMGEMGKAMMGTGEATGERRAIEAAEAAISNPLLDDVSVSGARGVLINVTGGHDITLFEVDEAANRIREEVDPDANIYFGSTFEESMQGKLRVTVVATGIDVQDVEQPVGQLRVLQDAYAFKAEALKNKDHHAKSADEVSPLVSENSDIVKTTDHEIEAHKIGEPNLFDNKWANEIQDSIEKELGLELDTLSDKDNDHQKSSDQQIDQAHIDAQGDNKASLSNETVEKTEESSIVGLAAKMIEEAKNGLQDPQEQDALKNKNL
ncbi:MAG: cell division protein FtsZ, partial [Pseudomonadota bacterium]